MSAVTVRQISPSRMADRGGAADVEPRGRRPRVAGAGEPEHEHEQRRTRESERARTEIRHGSLDHGAALGVERVERGQCRRAVLDPDDQREGAVADVDAMVDARRVQHERPVAGALDVVGDAHGDVGGVGGLGLHAPQRTRRAADVSKGEREDTTRRQTLVAAWDSAAASSLGPCVPSSLEPVLSLPSPGSLSCMHPACSVLPSSLVTLAAASAAAQAPRAPDLAALIAQGRSRRPDAHVRRDDAGVADLRPDAPREGRGRRDRRRLVLRLQHRPHDRARRHASRCACALCGGTDDGGQGGVVAPRRRGRRDRRQRAGQQGRRLPRSRWTTCGDGKRRTAASAAAAASCSAPAGRRGGPMPSNTWARR